ncbi:MAG: DUF768 domain-containing protein [Bauldia sp.]
MSRRFLRWVESWIEDNVAKGDGGDIEPFAVRAKRLADEILAEARGGGFRPDEIAEDEAKIPGLVTARLSAAAEFDISGFGSAPPDD